MSDQSHDRSDSGTTVAEAARILGITEGAVRKRVERHRLAAKRTADGRLIVYLGRDTTTTDTTRDRPRQSRGDRYTRGLVAEVEYLRRQLDQEREGRTEERRRHDTLMAQLTQANAALAARIPELEPPPEERESEVSPGRTSELGEVREELGTERSRREMAESTLREGMAEEQRRREEAERERDDLRRELHTLREPRESPQTVEEEPQRAEPRPATGGAQEGVRRRPWWRRIFGG